MTDYRVERNTGWAGAGCFGSAIYYEVGGDRAGYSSVSPEQILDQNLGTGSIIRVTVEVLAEKPMPRTCQNPWMGHFDHFKRSKDGWYLNSNCVCDGDGIPATEHQERQRVLLALRGRD